MSGKVAVIGECMLELRESGTANAPAASISNSALNLAYGGDTLNTAVYLSRLGQKPDYVTALGDDSLSDWMLDQWRTEGVGCELVERHAGSVPGLYMIQTDAQGERSFLYWRDSAPAKRLFDDEHKARELFEILSRYDWIYLSGITLSLYSEPSLQRFIGLLAHYRDNGGKIAFDGNYRPRLWPSASVAQEAFKALYRLTTIALPTLDDELLLFRDDDSEAVVRRLRSWSVDETVLKMGGEGCLVVTSSNMEHVPARKVSVVDTTAAGDSFNAGYLAARLEGRIPGQAAEAGHSLASVVIGHRGAIVPSEKMP